MSISQPPLEFLDCFQCSPAAKLLLKTGIDVYSRADMDQGDMMGPGYIRFRLDEAFLLHAVKSLNACTAAGFDGARIDRYPDEIGDNGVAEFSSWELCFGGGRTWFRGYTNTDRTCSSVEVAPERLVELLDDALAGKPRDPHEQVALFGGTLFLCDIDLDDLLESVLAAHPEIKAADEAAKMSAGITSDLAGAASSDALPATPASSRRGAL